MTTFAAVSNRVSMRVSAHDFAPALPVGSRLAALVSSDELQGFTRLARTLVPSASDADDLVQEALVRALRAPEQFADGSNLGAWMHTVMVRIAIDRGRRARRRQFVCEIDALVAPDNGSDRDEEPAPWAGLDIGDVRAAATRLPETLRRAFQMFAFEGKSYEEIATLLEIPVRTVGTRLCRARKKLRELLQAGRTVAFTGLPRKPPGKAAVAGVAA
jgi:RNA polymerase sigma-70 factor, ECF subfamily